MIAQRGEGRLPDFVIIGAMKAGSTSLFRWLEQHEDIWLPQEKEPNFFGDDHYWSRGMLWYSSLFAGLPPGAITGEASVAYTAPDTGPRAAARLARSLPSAKLVFIARHPGERLRSHYRHEVQAGRERRPLVEAVGAEGNGYVSQSCYSSRLAPYLERVDRALLHLVVFEELFGDDGTAWDGVLRFLGVSSTPRPTTRHNESAAKPSYRRVMARPGIRRAVTKLSKQAPRPVRRVLRPAVLRDDPFAPLLAASSVSLPDDVVEQLASDAQRFEDLLGRSTPWSFDRTAA